MQRVARKKTSSQISPAGCAVLCCHSALLIPLSLVPFAFLRFRWLITDHSCCTCRPCSVPVLTSCVIWSHADRFKWSSGTHPRYIEDVFETRALKPQLETGWETCGRQFFCSVNAVKTCPPPESGNGQEQSHPGHNLFKLPPSGRRYRSLLAKTARHKTSFSPLAISLLNNPLWHFAITLDHYNNHCTITSAIIFIYLFHCITVILTPFNIYPCTSWTLHFFALLLQLLYIGIPPHIYFLFLDRCSGCTVCIVLCCDVYSV